MWENQFLFPPQNEPLIGSTQKTPISKWKKREGGLREQIIDQFLTRGTSENRKLKNIELFLIAEMLILQKKKSKKNVEKFIPPPCFPLKNIERSGESSKKCLFFAPTQQKPHFLCCCSTCVKKVGLQIGLIFLEGKKEQFVK